MMASSSALMLPTPASGLSKSKAHPCTASLLLFALLKKLEFIDDLSNPGRFVFFVFSLSCRSFSLCSCCCLSCSALRCSASFPFAYGTTLVSSNSPSSRATFASNLAWVSFLPFLAARLSVASFCAAFVH
jgi:hypothetical protein